MLKSYQIYTLNIFCLKSSSWNSSSLNLSKTSWQNSGKYINPFLHFSWYWRVLSVCLLRILCYVVGYVHNLLFCWIQTQHLHGFMKILKMFLKILFLITLHITYRGIDCSSPKAGFKRSEDSGYTLELLFCQHLLWKCHGFWGFDPRLWLFPFLFPFLLLLLF